MIKYLTAGTESAKYDETDWPADVNVVNVYLNADTVPPFVPVAVVEQWIRIACFEWSAIWEKNFAYKGVTQRTEIPNSVVFIYKNSAQMTSAEGNVYAGLCHYGVTEKDSSGKWILDSARIELNSDYVLPGIDALPIITHETGHSCGLHDHNTADVSVMRIRPNGQHHLTLHDVQMLDRWNPYPVVYSPDGTLTCYSVAMPSGFVEFVRLKPFVDAKFPLMKAWRISETVRWDGPRTNNVTIGDNTTFDGSPAQIVHMAHVTHMDGVMRVEFYLQHDTLYLKHAETASG